MSEALARKYRPKKFGDVAVQSHVAATLKGAIERGRVAHGYLLCGPRGVGKTTLARVLAMALNCERRGEPSLGGEPCGECGSCRRIWRGETSLDVVEIDAASNRGVDDARELRERAMYAPSGDERYKVYIVDEAHMLTREAWNALLKILEEPPPRVVFVFATTEPQKIAQAAAPVLSRLQRFDLKRIGAAEIKSRLREVLAAERVEADADALAAIARAADGSMRDALSLADQVLSTGDLRVTAERVREALGLVPEDEFLSTLDLIAERRAGDVFALTARLADAGVDFGLFLTGLADMLRAQLAVVLGSAAPDVSDRVREALDARRDRLPAGDLLRMINAIGELEPRFRRSGQQQLLLEALLVRFALLDRTASLEEMIRGIGGGAAGRGGGAIPSRAEERGRSVRSPERGASAVAAPPALETRHAAPAAPPEPPRSRALDPPRGTAVDLNSVVGRWDELLRRIRAERKTILASALEHVTPVGVTARGELTVQLDEPNDFLRRAFEAGRGDVIAVLREWFSGLTRVQLVREDGAAPTPPPKRLTDEMVRNERLTALRKSDPLLGAAIEALDLDVVD
ncbi:MAG: DNA polymerase III subunit gamma/tau [Gemmatimonadaceae bacterium]